MRKFTLLFFSFFALQNLHSQSADMSAAEDELLVLLDDLRSAGNNQDKKEANSNFKTKLKVVLQDKAALNYPFSKLTTVGIINSSDKKMRIINWNVEQDDLSHSYNCFVLYAGARQKKYIVTELLDKSFGMPMHPEGSITSDNWYGALYYQIIPVKKGSKTLYTVLGWDYNTTMSQMKIIDVIYFTGSVVKLGSPIFKEGKTTKRRVFFEHSKKAAMSLKYEEDRNRIIFNQLAPESPALAKLRSFYVPSFVFDAFILEGSKWIFKEDVIVVNKEGNETTRKIYVKNEDTGEIEEKIIEFQWVDPSDPNAPGGANKHVAVTPDNLEGIGNGDSEKPRKQSRIKKKNKKDPRGSIFDDVDKKSSKRRQRKNNKKIKL